MIQVGMEEFHLFLQGKGLVGVPKYRITTATMEFVDKHGHVHAKSTYTATSSFVTVRYEIAKGK